MAKPTVAMNAVEPSSDFLIAVVVCNIVKLVSFIITLRVIKEAPLVTIGDAIPSSLEEPDDRTKGYSIISAYDVTTAKWRQPIGDLSEVRR
jgi:hypothetical protein